MTSLYFFFIICFFAALFIVGILLSLAAGRNKAQGHDDLESRIEKVLPGVQCGQCGYPGCHGYAVALAKGETSCDKCAPGGPDTVKALCNILNIDPPSGNESESIFTPRKVAFIDGALCTGCTKCQRVCPVDAIRGKARMIHEVDPEECIGCDECVKRCPEHCISLIRLNEKTFNFDYKLSSIRFKVAEK